MPRHVVKAAIAFSEIDVSLSANPQPGLGTHSIPRKIVVLEDVMQLTPIAH